jgi:hypothetical protein
LILHTATPGHFWEARQELAALKQLAGLPKNALARPAHDMGLAETMIKAERGIRYQRSDHF